MQARLFEFDKVVDTYVCMYVHTVIDNKMESKFYSQLF